RTGRLSVTWTGTNGLPISATVSIYASVGGAAWTFVSSTRTDVLGQATFAVTPRVTTTYQARGEAGPGWDAATSANRTVVNVPPLSRAVLPRRAPRPTALPAQRRAVGAGANAVVNLISDATWARMVGRSWRAGCPVGRTSLRYVQVNYWGFDGYRHRGELVVRATAASRFALALTNLYDARIRIRAMYLPDRFGYSRRSRGADDYASMRHDNTSAFNCRVVTGGHGTRSPHAYGTAIDLNPFENPFHSEHGWLPNRWWVSHRAGNYTWRSSSAQVVRIMRSSGFTWTYRMSDSQHFDTRP
ncbi:MAG: M15 family metallopeptidase, partial [Marmoricola sp.]